jgi:TonB family protein
VKYALAASLALHAIGFALLRAAEPAPEARPAKLESVDLEVAGSVGTPAAVAAAPATPKRSRRVFSPPAVVAAPMPSPPGEAPVVDEAPAPPAPAASIATVGAAGDAAGAGAAVGQQPKMESPDLSSFFARLQASARRCSGARKGLAKVRFCIDRAGAPTDVSLVQSSGNFALDDAAMHCVIPGAAPLPPFDKCLVVPIAFR